MVEDDQRHAPTALSLGKTPGTYCVGGCLGPKGRGRVRKISLLPEFDPWTVQPAIPACAIMFNTTCIKDKQPRGRNQIIQIVCYVCLIRNPCSMKVLIDHENKK